MDRFRGGIDQRGVPDDGDGRLFPFGNIRKGFDAAVERAGLEDVTFHTLRHTFASHMTMGGCDPMTLAKLLGHSNVRTTMRYSHLAPDFGKLAIGKLKIPVTNLQHRQKQVYQPTA